MSLSYVPLSVVRISDPVTNVDSVHSYSAFISGSKVSLKPYSTTNIAQSAIIWKAQPPADKIITDRYVTASVPVRITFVGTLTTQNVSYSPTGTILNANLDAPREFPLSGSTSTLQVSVNNYGDSVDLQGVVHPLSRFNNGPTLRSREYSQTPNYPDASMTYNDLIGTARNPLGNYGNSQIDAPVGRGGYPFNIFSNVPVIPTTSGAVTTAGVDIIITEPLGLCLPPFYGGALRYDTQGFYNVNSFDVSLNFITNAANRMWSHSAATPIASSGSINVYSNITSSAIQLSQFANPAFSYAQTLPVLQFKFYTPSLLENLPLNMPYTYPYSKLQKYTTDISAIAYSGDATMGTIVTAGSIQLNQIPNRMYVGVRPTDQTLQNRMDLTDGCMSMTNFSIQFANQNTVLSTASQYQLYQMNVKNGYEGSWSDYSQLGLYNSAFPGTAGSAKYSGPGAFQCFVFGDDIQLSSENGEAPGKGGQFQLQITATVRNPVVDGSWDNLPLSFVIIVVNEGTYTITSGNSAVSNLGVLSAADVLDAQSRPGVNARTIVDYQGGSFLDDLGNLASRFNNFLKESKIISTIGSVIPHPTAQTASGVARTLGYSGLAGGCDMAGGVAIGASSRSKLKRNLRR